MTALESRREEFQLVWHEIVAGKRPRVDALSPDIASITARAMEALRTLGDAIRRNPATGQARRLVWFLAAVYNGPEFLFDLATLRARDGELANAARKPAMAFSSVPVVERCSGRFRAPSYSGKCAAVTRGTKRSSATSTLFSSRR